MILTTTSDISSSTILALLVAAYTIYFYLSDYIEKQLNKKKGIPTPDGPFRLPFIGNIPQFLWNKKRHLHYLDELFNKYGEVVKVKMGPTAALLVNSPELVKHVLQDNFNVYDKGPYFHMIFEEFLGDGIFNSDGQKWRIQRKTASHMFTIRNLREHMSEVFIRHGGYFLEQIQKRSVLSNYVDINIMYQQFTLDSIGEIAFGYHLNSIGGKNNEFSKSFDQASNATAFRFISPYWMFCKWFLPTEREYVHSIRKLNKFAFEKIEERRQNTTQNEDGKKFDLLSKFIQMKDENGKNYSDTYLRDLIMNFIIAGRDTTAVTLSWATYMLCLYPDVQQKVIDEIDKVTGGNPPTYEKANQLIYLHNVISETLRLHPPIHVEIKQAKKEDYLPTGHFVPENCPVAFSLYSLNRSEKLWADPNEFRPDRWVGRNPTAFEFATFNAGPRTCMGKQMAFLEAKTLLSIILQKYTIELKPHQEVTYDVSVTMALRNGLFVHLKPRST